MSEPTTPTPRHGCAKYFAVDGNLLGITETPRYITRAAFDAYVKDRAFVDGPFMDSFGDGYGEPYNPSRQIYGVIVIRGGVSAGSHVGVFAELNFEKPRGGGG